MRPTRTSITTTTKTTIRSGHAIDGSSRCDEMFGINRLNEPRVTNTNKNRLRRFGKMRKRLYCAARSTGRQPPHDRIVYGHFEANRTAKQQTHVLTGEMVRSERASMERCAMRLHCDSPDRMFDWCSEWHTEQHWHSFGLSSAV